MIKVTVYNQQKDMALSRKEVRQIVERFSYYNSIASQEVAIHFVTKKKIQDLHAQFFDDPSLTDCITFPYDHFQEQDGFLGEVFICPFKAKQFIEDNGGDPYDELTLYLVHGLLHLIGFDDLVSKDKAKMRREEKKNLEKLKRDGLCLKNPV